MYTVLKDLPDTVKHSKFEYPLGLELYINV